MDEQKNEQMDEQDDFIKGFWMMGFLIGLAISALTWPVLI